MKKAFFGYYPPSERELRAMWQSCLFVFDANVLLNLYRYSKEAREDLVRVLQAVSDRLWIPHQVGLEYQENRLNVIADQIKKYSEVEKILQNARNNLQTELGNLQLEKRHSLIDPSGLLSQVEQAVDQFGNELQQLRQQQPDVHNEDNIRNEIDALFEGRVGSPPASQEWLNKLYEEGKTRYEQRRPPGYMDLGKSRSNDEEYLVGDLMMLREFGDLIIWKQILEEARTRERLNHLVFITDDEKEDWWWTVNSGGSKKLGPRPELVEEMYREANISCFYMYNSERFLSYAQTFLNIQVKQESVDQVRDVAQLSESGRRYQELRHSGLMAERAVNHWLRSLHSPDISIEESQRFPDFVLTKPNGTQSGYEVKYVRHVRLFVTRLWDLSYRGYYEIAEGKLTEFYVVCVLDDEEQMADLIKLLTSARLDLPTNVDIIVGGISEVSGSDGITRQEFAPFSQFRGWEK